MQDENRNHENNANLLLGEVRIRMMDYMIHFKTDGWRVNFEAYPIQDWTNLSTGLKGISYLDKEQNCDTVDVFIEEKCLKKFEGSFCYRGVWEGRLYFTDYEYWGEEISEMSDLYNKHIVPYCKDFIKKRESLNIDDE